jgi:ATP-binding cassette subfamily B protein
LSIVTVRMSRSVPVTRTSRSHARRSLQFVTPYALPILGIVALALLIAGAGAVEPLAMKRFVDALSGGGAGRAVATALLMMVVLDLSRSTLSCWLDALTWDVRLRIDFHVRQVLVGKLNSLPVTFHHEHGAGSVTTKMNQAIAGFVAAFGDLAFKSLPAMLYLSLSVIAMVRMDWRLALIVAAAAPLPALIGARAARAQARRERMLMGWWARVFSRFNEVLVGIRTVKGFAMEDVERQRFLRGVRRGNGIVLRGTRHDAMTNAFSGLAAALARIAAAAVGGWFVFRGEITVGTLIAFLGYTGGLFGPVRNLTNVYQTVRRGAVALETIFDILDADDPVADVEGAQPIEVARGEVRFENVSFAYAPGAPVLKSVDLHVRAGEMVALVGASGSGKSTLVSLLERVHAVSSGRILVDGYDIRLIQQRALRSQIGVVLQDVHLFNDTVRANIAYGTPGASAEDIEVAARAANAHEFISALPRGYDTIVGERGGRLSGGQRQRVAIARALLKNPPILILDEATSALDTVSEALVQEALRALMRGRTTFVVAHRLSTVADADKIVILQDGAITAAGTHDELLRDCPYYASLVRGHEPGFVRMQGMQAA